MPPCRPTQRALRRKNELATATAVEPSAQTLKTLPASSATSIIRRKNCQNVSFARGAWKVINPKPGEIWHLIIKYTLTHPK